jgi:CRISPR/Cas system CMR-associated protein Cmr5 small subunit
MYKKSPVKRMPVIGLNPKMKWVKLGTMAGSNKKDEENRQQKITEPKALSSGVRRNTVRFLEEIKEEEAQSPSMKLKTEKNSSKWSMITSEIESDSDPKSKLKSQVLSIDGP